MEFFFLFIAFVIFCDIVVPLLRDAVFLLVEFLALCIFEVVKLIGRALGWILILPLRGLAWIAARICEALVWVLLLPFRATAWIAVRTFEGLVWAAIRIMRGAQLGCVFLFYLADEWLRGPREQEASPEEEQEEEQEDPGEENAAAQAYEDALALFGLSPGFNRTALHTAWKRAIKMAHPDAGGSHEQAQAINTARDLIAARMGWT